MSEEEAWVMFAAAALGGAVESERNASAVDTAAKAADLLLKEFRDRKSANAFLGPPTGFVTTGKK